MESTLSAAFSDLTGDVGFFLGFGRGADNGYTAWDSESQATVDRCVKGGLRKVYFCGHDWSFLTPVSTINLASGASIAPLPDDFGGTDCPIYILDDSRLSSQVEVVGSVLRMYANSPETTGQPAYAEIEPIKGTTARTGQRYQLRIWPIADQAYTLQLKYRINPNYLSGSLPYVYGGPKHAETFLESCLAIAEKIVDDAASVHEMEFQKCLAASIAMDSQEKPQVLGYNGNRRVPWRPLRDEQYTVTYNGAVPGA